jgi:hypothetical protein
VERIDAIIVPVEHLASVDEFGEPIPAVLAVEV